MNGGSWLLDGDRIVPHGGGVAGDALFVPGEHVLLLAIDLPLVSHRRRIEALPFAIEDRIAEPLDSVHVAIGPELTQRRYLAAVVKHDRMREWSALAEAQGLGRLPLVPEPLALATPPAGHWSIDIRGKRAIVRTDDGGGFVTSTALLPLAWEAGGTPTPIVQGGSLPDSFPGEGERPAAPAELDPGLRRGTLDLRQGAYARRQRMPTLWRRAAIVAGAGLAAHGAIAAADTAALRSIAADRRAETQALVARAAPGMPIGDDAAAVASAMLPTNTGNASPFLPKLARASAALAPLSPGVSIRALSFDGALKLELEADDKARLEHARRLLARAGLHGRSDGIVAESGAHVRTVIILPGQGP